MKIARGNRNVLGRKNLPQRHFVHRKSHMTRPGFEPGSQRLTASAMARPIFVLLYDLFDALRDSRL
jgi:hypothetical protein